MADRLHELLRLSIRLDDDGRIDSRATDCEDDADREELLHDEARTVLESQLHTLDDIDDKAARTVRITALLVGGVFGAISFADASSLVVNQFTWWGGVSLLLAVVLGMTTYSQSSAYLGPNPDDLGQLLRTTDSQSETMRTMLNEGYRNWIAHNARLNGINATLLTLTRWSLTTSLVLFGIGLSIEFADGVSTVPDFGTLEGVSYLLPFVRVQITIASLPVLFLFILAGITLTHAFRFEG